MTDPRWVSSKPIQITVPTKAIAQQVLSAARHFAYSGETPSEGKKLPERVGRAAAEWIGRNLEKFRALVREVCREETPTRRMKRPEVGVNPGAVKWTVHNTKLAVWEERDRTHVRLEAKPSGRLILEWWDEEARQAVEDGFLDTRDLHGSAVAYANYIGAGVRGRKKPSFSHGPSCPCASCEYKRIKENPRQRRERLGQRVRVAEGSGIDSGKTGVVISRTRIVTDGRGIPIAARIGDERVPIEGHYQPANWSKEEAVLLDDGRVITMFKSRLVNVRGNPLTRDEGRRALDLARGSMREARRGVEPLKKTYDYGQAKAMAQAVEFYGRDREQAREAQRISDVASARSPWRKGLRRRPNPLTATESDLLLQSSVDNRRRARESRTDRGQSFFTGMAMAQVDVVEDFGTGGAKRFVTRNPSGNGPKRNPLDSHKPGCMCFHHVRMRGGR